MLDIYTVTFFGHRVIKNQIEIEERIEQIARELISTKEYVEFLVGRNGDFDQCAASAVRRANKALDRGNCSLILVLPYMTAEFKKNEKGFYDYYDDVEICGKSERSHFKAAIGIRNREMTNRSDLVICCIEHESGGAYNAVKYARESGKTVIDLAAEI